MLRRANGRVARSGTRRVLWAAGRVAAPMAAAVLATAGVAPAAVITLNNSEQAYTGTSNVNGLAGQYYNFAQPAVAGAEPTISTTVNASPNFTAPAFVPTYQSTLNTTVAATLVAPNAGATIAYSNVNFGNPNASSTAADFGNLAPFNNTNGVGANNFGPVGFATTDNITARWSGYITLPAGVTTFATNSDDGSVVYIDGVRVVNNNQSQGNTRRIGQTANFATAGQHEIVIAYYEGTGGAGMQARYAPGVATTNVNDAAFQIIPVAGVLTGPQAAPLALTDDIVVTGGTTNNTLAISNALNSTFNSVVFDATGSPTTTALTLKGSSARFGSTTFNGGTVNLLPSSASAFAQDFGLGRLNDNSVNVTVQNDRNRIILDETTNASTSGNTTFNIRGGGLILAGSAAAGSVNPAGTSVINLNTPTVAGVPNPVLTLTSKSGNVTFDNLTNVNESATIEARQVDLFGTASVGTGNPIAALGGTNGITIASGKTLTANSANTYTLRLNGGVTGAGGLTVTGGTVALGNAAAATPVNSYAGPTNVTGGTFAINTPITATSGFTITNNPTVQLNTTASVDRALTVNSNGAQIQYNANNAAGDNVLNATGTPTPNVTGRIVIGSAVTSFGGDTFNIGAFNTLTLPNTTVAGLIDRTGATPNLVAAPNAVIAEAAAGVNNAAAPKLGTNADLFFGIAATITDSTTVGTGTPWKGISNDGAGRNWSAGTITANSPFVIQSVGANNFDVGQATGGATVNIVTPAGGSPVDVTFGGGNVRMIGGNTTNNGGIGTADFSGVNQFIIPSGVSTQAGSGGTGTSVNVFGGAGGTRIPPVVVQSGGTLNLNGQRTDSGSLNAATTIMPGGILLADDASNLNGTGVITMSAGSIMQVTNSPFGTQSPNTVPGTIVRLAGDNQANLDANVNDAAIYVVFNGNRTQTATPITLNQTALNNGALTQDGNNARTFTGSGGITGTGNTAAPNANTGILIGANGGTIASSTGQTLTLTSNVQGGKVTINAAAPGIPDGSSGANPVAKAGTVRVTGANTFVFAPSAVDVVAGQLTQSSGGIFYNIGTNGTGPTTIFGGATYLQDTATVGFTRLVLNSGSTARFQGNGTGGVSNIGSFEGAGNVILGPAAAVSGLNALTLTTGINNLDAAHTGVVSQSNLSAGGNLVKSGTGALTLDGGADTYQGTTTVGTTTASGGVLIVNNAHGTAAARVGSYTVNSGSRLGGAMGPTNAIFLATGATVNVSGGAAPANGNALLAPGALTGTGQMNVDGGNGVVLGDNSTFAVDVAGTQSDLLNLVGPTSVINLVSASNTLDVQGFDDGDGDPNTGVVTIAQFPGYAPGVNTFETILANGQPAQNTDPTQPNYVNVVYNPTNIQLQTANVVPEPATAGVLAVAALGLLARRRRRR